MLYLLENFHLKKHFFFSVWLLFVLNANTQEKHIFLFIQYIHSRTTTTTRKFKTNESKNEDKNTLLGASLFELLKNIIKFSYVYAREREKDSVALSWLFCRLLFATTCSNSFSDLTR